MVLVDHRRGDWHESPPRHLEHECGGDAEKESHRRDDDESPAATDDGQDDGRREPVGPGADHHHIVPTAGPARLRPVHGDSGPGVGTQPGAAGPPARKTAEESAGPPEQHSGQRGPLRAVAANLARPRGWGEERAGSVGLRLVAEVPLAGEVEHRPIAESGEERVQDHAGPRQSVYSASQVPITHGIALNGASFPCCTVCTVNLSS